MLPVWSLFAAVVVATAIRSIVLDRRIGAHLRYVQQELRELGGEDRWDARCTHCGRPIRDRASIRYTTKTATGETWVSRTDGVFHLDRSECSSAAGLEVDR